MKTKLKKDIEISNERIVASMVWLYIISYIWKYWQQYFNKEAQNIQLNRWKCFLVWLKNTKQ